MKAGLKVLWIAVITFVVAFAAQQLLVPDVVPIGYADEPQSSWSVMVAFVLRAIELTTAWVAAIALVVAFGAWARTKLRRAH
ncbi:MAG TPA: hypothetical protein VHB49_04640 [Bradyrhizobium sp.]|nr:hypothetical protein [Bradyrhizobium sp.]